MTFINTEIRGMSSNKKKHRKTRQNGFPLTLTSHKKSFRLKKFRGDAYSKDRESVVQLNDTKAEKFKMLIEYLKNNPKNNRVMNFLQKQ